MYSSISISNRWNDPSTQEKCIAISRTSFILDSSSMLNFSTYRPTFYLASVTRGKIKLIYWYGVSKTYRNLYNCSTWDYAWVFHQWKTTEVKILELSLWSFFQIPVEARKCQNYNNHLKLQGEVFRRDEFSKVCKGTFFFAVSFPTFISFRSTILSIHST